jgi:hypothetical protein
MGDGNWLEESPNGFISETSRSTLPRAFYLAMPRDNAEPFVYETHNYNNNHKEEVGTGTSLCSMASLSANRTKQGVTARPQHGSGAPCGPRERIGGYPLEEGRFVTGRLSDE